MKRSFAISLQLMMCAGSLFAGSIKYDAAKFTPEYAGEDILDAKCKLFKKLNVKKVCIVECYGEYLQSKEISPSALEKSAWEKDATNWIPLKSQISTMDLGGDYYAFATDQVYDKICKTFTDNGIEVVGKDVVANNPLYAQFELETEDAGGGYTGGMMKQSVTSKTLKRSSTGLGLFSNNPLKLMRIVPKLGQVIKETGADAAVRVMFYVDKGRDGAPLVTQYKMAMYGGVEEQTTGFKGHEKTNYYLKYQNEGIFDMQKAVENPADIAGPEKGTISISKYNAALQAIMGSLTDGFKACLAKALK